jgi:hypothetical protein
VNPPSVVRHGVVAAVLLVLAQAAADAQTPVTKAPPRLPPNASQTSRIPAGTDTGTPASSDTVELGTPVPPNLGGDRSEMRTRSAAARAAARPKLPTSSADCTRLPAGVSAAKPGPTNAAAKAGSNGASAASPSTATRGTPTGC